MGQSPRFDVVFVLGHSHCGSTLLGRMLDGHPRVACAGELLWVNDALARGLPCSCGQPLPACPAWTARLDALAGARDDYRTTRRPALDALRAVEGRDVLVDLSKSRVHRVRPLRRDRTAGFIYLVRDPRGVLASRLRDQPNADWDRELRKHRKWTRRFERMARYHAPRSLILHYEDLTARPKEVLGTVCDFLDLGFAAAMLAPSDRPHHYAHSSISTYLGGTNALRRDERWRSELSPDRARQILATVGGLASYRGRYLPDEPLG